MMTITQSQLDALLAKEANYNLGVARRNGALTICQTRLGNIDVTYDTATKTYSAVVCGTVAKAPSPLFTSVKAGEARTVIAGVFVVALENTTVVSD